MTTDLYANTIIADGQQIDTAFLNNGTRFNRAMLTDQILQSLIGSVANAATRPDFGGDDGADVSALWAYAVSPGRAFLRQGSANNKLQIAPGTLLQKIANADGNDSTLVPFTFAGTEEFTLTNGDVTNPRVDLLQMALSYTTDTLITQDFEDDVTRALTTVANTPTRRRILCTLSVKAGTPAASPTIPDPDAGCVPVGTVVVGHGWTTGGNAPIFGVDTVDTNNAVVHDQRMPLGVSITRVDPVLYKLELAWGLDAANKNQTVTASNATNKMFAGCPVNSGRLLGLAIRMSPTSFAAGSITIGAMKNTFSATPSAGYTTQNKFTLDTSTAGQLITSLRAGFEGNHVPTAGPTIQQSAVNKIGVPLWASGFRVPQTPASVTPQWLAFGIINDNNTSTIGEASFIMAGI